MAAAAARNQLQVAHELLSASLTGLEGERRSTLRYGYLVARQLGRSAIRRAHSQSSGLRKPTSTEIRAAILSVEHRFWALQALETTAIESGVLSSSLLVEEVSEQILERRLDDSYESLFQLVDSGKPLVPPLLSEGERLGIIEFAYERLSKRLVLDAIVTLFAAEGQRASEHDLLASSRPSVYLVLQREGVRLRRLDAELVHHLGPNLGDMETIIKDAFLPFVQYPFVYDLPPLSKPPAGKLF
jgi:hypothetical protein